MTKLLTISIPTFNHHDSLFIQLKSLLPQVCDEIQINIFDNCSTPPIRSFLTERGIELSKINIVENKENIGGDNNIFKCTKTASSDFVWVLSDNDIVAEDAIQKILEIINKNSNAFFINLYSSGRDIEYSTGLSEFYEKATYWATFSISHCIFNTKKIFPYLNYYEQCIKTHQPQLLTTIKILKENKDTICCFVNLSIFQHSKPATWSKAAFINDTLLIFKTIPKEELSHFKKTLGRQVIKTLFSLLIIARIYEGLSTSDYVKLHFKIMSNSKRRYLFSSKSILSCFVCFVSPRILYHIKKIKNGNHQIYTFSKASKNLDWNY